jgi:hypothetical protein
MVWFHDARRTFNQALDYACKQGWHDNPTAFDRSLLQKEFVAAAQVKDKRLLRTPKVILQQAIKSLHSDFKRHKTNLKKWSKTTKSETKVLSETKKEVPDKRCF